MGRVHGECFCVSDQKMYLTSLSLLTVATFLGQVIGGPVAEQNFAILKSNFTAMEPDPNCPMVGFDCLFHDIERGANSGTWQECAQQCFNHRSCAFWSWRVPSAGVNPYGCWLKPACPLTIRDDWLISGEYSCTA